MTRRRSSVGFARMLIVLPLVLAAGEAAVYRLTNRPNNTLVFAGQTREFQLHVPASYDGSRPTPLVISMHGAGGWPVQQMELSGWNRLADSRGFIVVYPAAAEDFGPRVWHVDRGPGLLRDVGFIAALIDTLSSKYNIDAARVYANGFSNGGGMSFALSCTMPDRIAAVGMVGAAQTLQFGWCPDKRPVPMIQFSGSADPLIPYDGGKSWIAPDTFPNVPLWVKAWARRNDCAPRAVDSVIAADVTRLEYPRCAGDAAVVLYTIHGGGHTWPGGDPLPKWFTGTTSNSVDATRLIWEFYLAHPMKAR